MELILSILAVAVAWLASRHWPLSAAQGRELHGSLAGCETKAGRGSFTVGTYNIHRGRGLDGKRNLARIARTIEGCDVVGLQEVEGHGLRHFGNQAYQLGQDCEYAAHFSPTRRHFFFPHRGNALLTRLPVTHWQREPLSPTTGKAYRNMTAYTISFNGEVVYVINTHLSKPEEQIAPLRRVLEVFSSLERVVLLGDFNAHPARPELQELLASGIEDATSIASQDPLRVDWILVRGLKVLWARSEPTGPSDHPFYLASLSLK